MANIVNSNSIISRNLLKKTYFNSHNNKQNIISVLGYKQIWMEKWNKREDIQPWGVQDSSDQYLCHQTIRNYTKKYVIESQSERKTEKKQINQINRSWDSIKMQMLQRKTKFKQEQDRRSFFGLHSYESSSIHITEGNQSLPFNFISRATNRNQNQLSLKSLSIDRLSKAKNSLVFHRMKKSKSLFPAKRQNQSELGSDDKRTNTVLFHLNIVQLTKYLNKIPEKSNEEKLADQVKKTKQKYSKGYVHLMKKNLHKQRRPLIDFKERLGLQKMKQYEN